jgi:hypothetical protein
MSVDFEITNSNNFQVFHQLCGGIDVIEMANKIE